MQDYPRPWLRALRWGCIGTGAGAFIGVVGFGGAHWAITGDFTSSFLRGGVWLAVLGGGGAAFASLAPEAFWKNDGQEAR